METQSISPLDTHGVMMLGLHNKEYTGCQKKYLLGTMLEIGKKIYLQQKKIY